MRTWRDMIGSEKAQPYFQHILQQVQQQRDSGKIIYPPKADVFNAFRYTEFDQVKVVILGQDPYHGPNQAHGLAFSVRPNVQIPPSLQNIYKELSQDIAGFQIPNHGYLVDWAQQGVLLLNTVLTVEQGKAHSHANFGWETFTDHVIATLNQHTQGLVFLLWGSHAQKKGQFIDRQKHCVLTAPHPSPLSAHRGFFGCHHFSSTNQYLIKQGKTPINWSLPNL
ncbi:uracil-DNA glycosylase [Gallibacterium anatis]|uniref:Uracil-DNA glycosylase n=1 Tax=Gallibacterium anatis (strain UMN179) TaxID=1005058 RepID=F4HES5_GALAU|nr:uracil-DNA glycosylase [Gallibacterium anatis]AEC18085.1 uracil-DNA glycosylase [Gallibacterium anatis UMN179]KGQ28411.1 uracil-DNA glycosylase [Gallibacterium anatis]KGQ45363.1 uracil-DNA glycosylase [Gallibacterium anatis]KGQ50594.1 uracil-DNA glycosylase [Gallibacterium anatis]KGQ52252.1 uracil-DNA glycosylase [Gallibacterium anatis]